MLQPEDFTGQTWRRLRAELERRIAELRLSNDAEHDQTRTAAIRGRIAEVKRILSLEPSTESEDEDPIE